LGFLATRVAFRLFAVAFDLLLILAMISSRTGILAWPRGFSELVAGGAGRSNVRRFLA
jgi:hypothetical protein